jgi:hypothetical protein
MLAACMGCGARLAVEPHTSLTDLGWTFSSFLNGWLCAKCAELDLAHPTVRKRQRGRPIKGDDSP